MEIFQYDFMKRAFLVGMLLAVITPCIGVIIVLKRLSMIGDAISHTSLAGVAAGLLFGINPILGAIIASVGAALSIEIIRKKIPQYAELSIVIIMSAGIGLAGLLSGMVKSSVNFNSFLFGSIVAISDFELFLVIGVSFIVMLTFVLLYKELFYISLDERAAILSGIAVKTINFIFTILTAITVSVAARTVGTLIVSSLMVIPVVSAMQLGKSYKLTVLYSVFFALLSTVVGLFTSFYATLKPGATIVIINIVILFLVISFRNLFAKKILAFEK